jgi:hypothetical protein
LVPAAELEGLEGHLLVCTSCQERLRETEAYVRIMQQATAQAAADQLARQGRWRAVGDWLIRSFPATAMAGAVALVLVWGIVPYYRTSATAPVAVALGLTRGDESLRAHAPAHRPLALSLDLTGVAPFPSYQVRIVDSGGAAVLDATARPVRDRLSVTAPARLARGTYWVRVYNPSEPQAPLREYGLALE